MLPLSSRPPSSTLGTGCQQRHWEPVSKSPATAPLRASGSASPLLLQHSPPCLSYISCVWLQPVWTQMWPQFLSGQRGSSWQHFRPRRGGGSCEQWRHLWKPGPLEQEDQSVHEEPHRGSPRPLQVTGKLPGLALEDAHCGGCHPSLFPLEPTGIYSASGSVLAVPHSLGEPVTSWRAWSVWCGSGKTSGR